MSSMIGIVLFNLYLSIYYVSVTWFYKAFGLCCSSVSYILMSLLIYFTDVGRIGIGICYDIRFQELAMLYAARGMSSSCVFFSVVVSIKL
jgi:hypothetical protein